MPITERHTNRERGGTLGEEGITSRARYHRALVLREVVVSDLLPDGPFAQVSSSILAEVKKSRRRLRKAEEVFFAEGDKYTVKVKGKKVKKRHGLELGNDGLDNRVREQSLPELPGVWLDAGGGFDPGRIKHDWQIAPYQDRTRKYG